MTMQCQDARQLVPGYLDGESSESQASLLRSHLMDCPACRGVIQEVKALRAWFEPTPAFAVPADFAARVARRAFAGDTGEAPELVAAGPQAPSHARGGPARSADFVMHLTAVAAAALFALTIALGVRDVPQGGKLHADQVPTVDALVEELDRLNAQEDLPAEPVAATPEETSELRR